MQPPCNVRIRYHKLYPYQQSCISEKVVRHSGKRVNLRKIITFADMDTRKNIRSLPLSLAGTSLGIMLAAADYRVDWKVASFLVMAVVFLHFYSVFSKSDQKTEKTWGRICLALTIANGLAMLYYSFGTLLLMEPLIMMVLGYMIIRAVRHTVFVSRGKGIIYIFVLFGLIAVGGSYYVCSHTLGSWPLLFPALSMAFLSIAAKAEDRRLNIAMIVCGWAAMIAYSCLRMFDPWHFLFILSLPLFFTKHQSLATFAFSILTGTGFLLYLLPA